MAATNAVITRISFCVIMLQQSVLRRSLFGIAGIGENWKSPKGEVGSDVLAVFEAPVEPQELTPERRF
jgi:hypothetical protein